MALLTVDELIETCPKCNGEGWFVKPSPGGPPKGKPEIEACPRCAAQGQVLTEQGLHLAAFIERVTGTDARKYR